MMTRQDYLDGKCTHSEYYRQLVENSNAISIVKWAFTIEELVAAYKEDKNFNTIPLAGWDSLAPMIEVRWFRDYGDYPTLAGHVCVAKEAATMIVEEYLSGTVQQ